MHLMHEFQVNGHYCPTAVFCWQNQLDHALHAALNTHGHAATHWVEEIERLAGRIAIAQAGGTIRCAAKFVPAERRNHLQDSDLVEPTGNPYESRLTSSKPVV